MPETSPDAGTDPCADDLDPCGDGLEPLPWRGVFDDGAGGCPHIRLEQRDEKYFRLTSSLRFVDYQGDHAPPSVTAGRLGCTDLTSVPWFLRWFIGTYGVHTPAALIHDAYTGADRDDDRSQHQADRDWLQMLEALGLPPWRRWAMYAAVSTHTRYQLGGWSRARIVLWATLSVLAILSVPAAAAVGFWGPDGWSAAATVVAVVGAVAWIPAALLWGRDYGFGIVAALTAIWVVPPTLFVGIGWLFYRVWEALMIVAVRWFGGPPAVSTTDQREQVIRFR